MNALRTYVISAALLSAAMFPSSALAQIVMEPAARLAQFQGIIRANPDWTKSNLTKTNMANAFVFGHILSLKPELKDDLTVAGPLLKHLSENPDLKAISAAVVAAQAEAVSMVNVQAQELFDKVEKEDIPLSDKHRQDLSLANIHQTMTRLKKYEFYGGSPLYKSLNKVSELEETNNILIVQNGISELRKEFQLPPKEDFVSVERPSRGPANTGLKKAPKQSDPDSFIKISQGGIIPGFGSLILSPDRYQSPFPGKDSVEQALREIKMIPEGNKLFRELQALCAFSGEKLFLISAKDLPNQNPLSKTASAYWGNGRTFFNPKIMRENDYVSIVASAMKVFATELRIKLFSPASQEVAGILTLSQRPAYTTANIIALRLGGTANLDYLLDDFSNGYRIPFKDLENPMEYYNQRLDELQKSKKGFKAMFGPQAKAALQILEANEAGPKKLLESIHKFIHTPVSPKLLLQRYDDAIAAVKTVQKSLSASDGEMLKLLQQAAHDPMLAKSVKDAANDLRKLSRLIQNQPSETSDMKSAFLALVALSQKSHPEYWKGYWEKYPPKK